MKLFFLLLNLTGVIVWTIVAWHDHEWGWLLMLMTGLNFIGMLACLLKSCPRCRKPYWAFHRCKVMPRGDYVVPSSLWVHGRPPGTPPRPPRVRDDTALSLGPGLRQNPPAEPTVVPTVFIDRETVRVCNAECEEAPRSNPAPVILEDPEPTKYSSPVANPTPTYSSDPEPDAVPDSSPLPDPPATDASTVC